MSSVTEYERGVPQGRTLAMVMGWTDTVKKETHSKKEMKPLAVSRGEKGQGMRLSVKALSSRTTIASKEVE